MRHYLNTLFFSFNVAMANAADIIDGQQEGTIVLVDGNRQTVYENITGTEYDSNRTLTTVNGSPAILVLGREVQYLTLIVERHQVFVDCAYSDTRNSNNGARVSVGVCGLNWQLDDSYRDIAQQYSDDLQKSIFSFDTTSIIRNSETGSFLLGKMGDIKIYDRYSSATALENALPQKYIVGPSGCFEFGDTVGFLGFYKQRIPKIGYLDIVQSEEPI